MSAAANPPQDSDEFIAPLVIFEDYEDPMPADVELDEADLDLSGPPLEL